MARPATHELSVSSADHSALLQVITARSSHSRARARGHAPRGGKVLWAMLAAAGITQPSMGAERGEIRFNHTVIATTGTAAPAGGNYVTFGDIVMNARGEIAFNASLRGTSRTGIFLRTDTATTTVALAGNDPAAGNLSGIVSTPFITAHGDVSFLSLSSDFTATIFRGDGTHLVQVVQDGDVAPGGGNLLLGDSSAISSSMDVNSRGVVTYAADVIGGSASRGIFRTDRKGTIAIATDSIPLPTGGLMTALVHTPSINERGEVAFTTEIDGGSAFGVFKGDGKHLTTLLASNQMASEVTLTDFGAPTINGRGQVLVGCNIRDPSGAAAIGLFMADGSDTRAIALEGGMAPEGGAYANLNFSVPLLNDRGQVAFVASLTGGSSRSGVFRADGHLTTAVALQGALAAGTQGAIFDGFGVHAMDAEGRVAFVAKLTPGFGDANSSNDIGIWVGSSAADLHLVARTGDSIGENNLLQIGGQLKLAGKGVAWIGGFSDGTVSIVHSQRHL